MSTINTNGINVNYPVPGVNNNSQGFRDNFAAIRTNLNTAATEITDLQNKAVLKQALTDTVINNDMANTLISNASTRGFRATTYNLGNALAGTVYVDARLGDVQIGTISEDVQFVFGGWAPTGTQSNIQLQLNVSNANAVVSFPSEVISSNNNFGTTTLENYANVSNVATVTIPYGVSTLDYRLSTLDCGNTITIEPFNRPRISTQIQQRTPSPVGFLGDVAGTVAVDANYAYVCTGDYAATTVTKTVTATYSGNLINCGSTTSLVLNSPITFTGNVNTANTNLVANTVYYIKTIPDGSNITVSATGFQGTAGTTFAVSAANANAVATQYSGTQIWQRIDLLAAAGNGTFANISVTGNANVGNLGTGGLITASGNITGGNIISSGIITATGNANVGNLGTSGLITATGNITGGNVTTGGDFSATGNITLGGVVTATGNITGGNVNTGGVLSATGNVIAGNITTSGIVSSNGTAGIGYATGAGGSVVQTSSRTSGVTLNKTTGTITLVSAAGSTSYNTFQVTNSTVAATDVIIVNQKSGTDKYEVFVTAVAAGSFNITFATTGGTTTEQPVFSFAVIKGVTS